MKVFKECDYHCGSDNFKDHAKLFIRNHNKYKYVMSFNFLDTNDDTIDMFIKVIMMVKDDSELKKIKSNLSYKLLKKLKLPILLMSDSLTQYIIDEEITSNKLIKFKDNFISDCKEYLKYNNDNSLKIANFEVNDFIENNNANLKLIDNIEAN